MKGHKRSLPTDVIPEPVNHGRKPNWLVQRRLQHALAIATEGRSYDRLSTIPLVEGLRFNLAGVEEGFLEFQGISRRAFVYRSHDHPLIIRGVQLLSHGLRYDIYSGPVLDRAVVTDYIQATQLDSGFLPAYCSSSVHAVELVVYDRWNKTWFAPTWYSLGKNQDTVPAFELTSEGMAERQARVATMRGRTLVEPDAPIFVKLSTEEFIQRIRLVLEGQSHFVITTDIHQITACPRILLIADIRSNVAHRLDRDILSVTYYFSGSQRTAQFPLFDLHLEKAKSIGDGYKAYVRVTALVSTGSESPDKTSHFAVINILDEQNQLVEHFICGVRA